MSADSIIYSGYNPAVEKKVEELFTTGEYGKAVDLALNTSAQLPEVVNLLSSSAKRRITALVKGKNSNPREALLMMFSVCRKFPQIESELIDHFSRELSGIE